ncbi:MAG: hypothetical protein P1V51_25290 [Deltaproteobacteria bacterium]|nr:hypothetical protein [Deltaproteobacteria bacterium]
MLTPETTLTTVDGRGLTTEVVEPSGHRETRSHDAAGRLELSERWSPGGTRLSSVTRRALDGLGRPEQVETWTLGATVASVTQSFDYGSAGDPLPVSGTGLTQGDYGAWTQVTDDGRGGESLSVVDGGGQPLAILRATADVHKGSCGPSTAGQTSALDLLTTFEHDALGRKVSETDPLGRTATWRYSAAGAIEAQTTFGGDSVTYGRDPQGREVSRSDPRKASEWPHGGFDTLTKYDELGRVMRVELSAAPVSGDTLIATYSRSGTASGGLWTVTETRPGLPEATSFFDHAGRRLRLQEGPTATYVTQYLHDGARETGRIEAGGYRVESTYDARGRVIERTEEGKSHTYAYDDDALTLADTNARGFTVAVSFDGAGRERGRSYTDSEGGFYEETTAHDALGNVVSTTRTTAAGTPETISRCYDAAGRLIETRGPKDRYRRVELDAAGRPIAEYDRPSGVSSLVALRTYDRRDNVIRLEDGEGVVSARAVDALGGTICEGTVDPALFPVPASTLLDPVGTICTNSALLPRLTRYAYGELGELRAIGLPGGPAPDATGTHQLGTVLYAYDAARRMKGRTDAMGHEVSYEYDPDRSDLRTLLRQHDGGQTFDWTVTYNANREPETRTDPAGNILTSVFGAYHLPTSVTYAGPDVVGSSPVQVATVHDDLGNPQTRILTRQDATTDHESFVFDAQGRKQSYTLASTAAGASQSATLEWDYHPGGQRSAVRVTGPGFGQTIETTYAFDTADQLTSTATTSAAGSYQTSQRYTPEGLPIETVYGDGSTACRQYDEAGRLSYLGHSLQTTACGSGDADPLQPPPIAGPLRSFAYAYGTATEPDLGNVRSITEDFVGATGAILSETQTFAFDGRDRLVAAAYADEARVWTYDESGNRTRQDTHLPQVGLTAGDYLATAATPTEAKAYTYDGRDHLLQVSDALAPSSPTPLVDYLYDDAGRTLTRTEATGPTAGLPRTYQWNADDSLRTATAPDGSQLGGYAYDAASLRRRKLSSAAAEGDRLYVYDGSSLLAELDAVTGAPVLVYVYGTELLGVLDYRTGSEQAQWLHRDGSRSVVERTAEDPATGTAVRIAGPYRFDAWGQYRGQGATGETPTTDGSTKVGYTGHLFDAETGLVYAKARYYVPEDGRFLSQDPLEGEMGAAPSLHRYAYAQGNPHRYYDPSGEQNELLHGHEQVQMGFHLGRISLFGDPERAQDFLVGFAAGAVVTQAELGIEQLEGLIQLAKMFGDQSESSLIREGRFTLATFFTPDQAPKTPSEAEARAQAKEILEAVLPVERLAKNEKRITEGLAQLAQVDPTKATPDQMRALGAQLGTAAVMRLNDKVMISATLTGIYGGVRAAAPKAAQALKGSRLGRLVSSTGKRLRGGMSLGPRGKRLWAAAADELGGVPTQTSGPIRAYHGTTGDSILSIIDDGRMVPKRDKIYLSETVTDTFVHGADRSRMAAFSIEVEVLEVEAGIGAVTRRRLPGNPNSIVITSPEGVPVKVKKMFVRTPDGRGGFSTSVVEGAEAIKAFLLKKG